MLPNEKFALERRAFYESIGLVVDSTNGEFAHCPYPEGMGDSGYYLLHDDHQHQGILQSRDTDQCCFFLGHAKRWLTECDPIPNNFFELWDIYDKYAGRHGKLNGKKGNKVAHEEKSENGKSILGIENAKRLNEAKDKNGKSINALKGNLQQKLLKIGIYALSSDQLSQNMKKLHEEKDEKGKSKHAVKAGKSAHKEKDELGRSIHGVKTAENTNSQVWESTIDGFRGNPGSVANHNKARGWDPGARVKVK